MLSNNNNACRIKQDRPHPQAKRVKCRTSNSVQTATTAHDQTNASSATRAERGDFVPPKIQVFEKSAVSPTKE